MCQVASVPLYLNTRYSDRATIANRVEPLSDVRLLLEAFLAPQEVPQADDVTPAVSLACDHLQRHLLALEVH